MIITDFILSKHAKYVVEKVKAPLLKTIIKYCQRYPTPTKSNLCHQNSKLLLHIQEEFLKKDQTEQRRELHKALFKALICEYEHDMDYRQRFDWLVERLTKEVNEGNFKLSPKITHRWFDG